MTLIFHFNGKSNRSVALEWVGSVPCVGDVVDVDGTWGTVCSRGFYSQCDVDGKRTAPIVKIEVLESLNGPT